MEITAARLAAKTDARGFRISLLSFWTGRSQPIAVGALNPALGMEAWALVHTLKLLERDGLVAVTIDPNDRRLIPLATGLPGGPQVRCGVTMPTR
jgi:hypothetical protein